MSTATLAMPINPQHEERRLYVLPFLQEATRNVDGYPLSCLSQFFTLSRIFPSLDTPNSTWGASKNFFLKSSLNTTNSLMTLFDHQYNTSSAYESLSLLKRLSLFATWIFSQNTPASTADTIIIIGHSIWLRKFLERYLPPESQCPYKKCKLSCCGILTCNILEYTNPTTHDVDYWIDPTSVQEVYNESNEKQLSNFPY
ncbi:uncharacterized protein LOC128883365 isoform X3 [Hylaeus volcanicus]|nr:uncharacterized protein LOC128883365 isoform X3 [Hylaeus volcanicus]